MEASVKFKAIFCFVIKIVIVMCMAERKLFLTFCSFNSLEKTPNNFKYNERLQVTIEMIKLLFLLPKHYCKFNFTLFSKDFWKMTAYLFQEWAPFLLFPGMLLHSLNNMCLLLLNIAILDDHLESVREGSVIWININYFLASTLNRKSFNYTLFLWK